MLSSSIACPSIGEPGTVSFAGVWKLEAAEVVQSPMKRTATLPWLIAALVICALLMGSEQKVDEPIKKPQSRVSSHEESQWLSACFSGFVGVLFPSHQSVITSKRTETKESVVEMSSPMPHHHVETLKSEWITVDGQLIGAKLQFSGTLHPLQLMGLKSGDVLLGSNNSRIKDLDSVYNVFKEVRTTENVVFKVKRQGKLEEIPCALPLELRQELFLPQKLVGSGSPGKAL